MEDHHQRLAADLADAERETWVQGVACRVVATLFDERTVTQFRPSIGPAGDREFADASVFRELELIAAGDDPVRISLHLAVMRTARDALRLCAEIDALPGR